MADLNDKPEINSEDIPGKTLAEDPKKLQLDDGTETEVAQDNAIQTKPLQDRKVKFNFQDGNFDVFISYGKDIAAKFQTVSQTILPLIEVALIELLGNDSLVKYELFNFAPKMSGNMFCLKVTIVASTKDWIGDDITLDATKQDAAYVLNRVSVVPNVRWEHCIIDTKDGTLTVEFTI